MGFFSELEESLEKYIEKLFKAKNRERLQPVDIARQMAREMRRNRRVGLKGVYVPNRYVITLSEKDFAALEPLLKRLANELQEYITEKAAEKKYVLAGPAAVAFSEDKGREIVDERMYVEGYYDRLPVDEQEQQPAPPEDTMRYVPLRVQPGQKQPPERESSALLERVAGGHCEERYVLSEEFTVIGRRETCDICLADHGISRKHAVITRSGDRYVISDQSSTNGTYVNGVKISRRVLEPGDIIEMGNTVFSFKVV